MAMAFLARGTDLSLGEKSAQRRLLGEGGSSGSAGERAVFADILTPLISVERGDGAELAFFVLAESVGVGVVGGSMKSVAMGEVEGAFGEVGVSDGEAEQVETAGVAAGRGGLVEQRVLERGVARVSFGRGGAQKLVHLNK